MSDGSKNNIPPKHVKEKQAAARKKTGKIEVRILADYKCPKCGKIQKQLDTTKEHFCPDCGAKMNIVPGKKA